MVLFNGGYNNYFGGNWLIHPTGSKINPKYQILIKLINAGCFLGVAAVRLLIYLSKIYILKIGSNAPKRDISIIFVPIKKESLLYIRRQSGFS